MPDLYNISLPAGDTFTQTFILEDEDGNPTDLSGCEAEFTVFDEDGNVVLEANTLTVGGIEIEVTFGSIVILCQTHGVGAGCYEYTLVTTSPGGIISTVVEGSFDLE